MHRTVGKAWLGRKGLESMQRRRDILRSANIDPTHEPINCLSLYHTLLYSVYDTRIALKTDELMKTGISTICTSYTSSI